MFVCLFVNGLPMAVPINNVHSVKKDTKCSSNTLLLLVSFFTEQTLHIFHGKYLLFTPSYKMYNPLLFCQFKCKFKNNLAPYCVVRRCVANIPVLEDIATYGEGF